MNLSLFITRANQEEMAGCVSRMAESQKEVVNGALCVTYQSQISKAKVGEIVAPLVKRFRTASVIPVQANLSATPGAQLAVMFGKWLLTGYGRYPGSWLVIDAPVEVVGDNWMTVCSKLHDSNGGKMVGRAVVGSGALLPVGPVSLELPFASMKFLRFGTNETWRERGRFLFSRCGFEQVEGWPFVDKGEVAVQEASKQESPAAMTKKELLDAVEAATGERPHHFTKEATLRAMIEQATTATV